MHTSPELLYGASIHRTWTSRLFHLPVFLCGFEEGGRFWCLWVVLRRRWGYIARRLNHGRFNCKLILICVKSKMMVHLSGKSVTTMVITYLYWFDWELPFNGISPRTAVYLSSGKRWWRNGAGLALLWTIVVCRRNFPSTWTHASLESSS